MINYVIVILLILQILSFRMIVSIYHRMMQIVVPVKQLSLDERIEKITKFIKKHKMDCYVTKYPDQVGFNFCKKGENPENGYIRYYHNDWLTVEEFIEDFNKYKIK